MGLGAYFLRAGNRRSLPRMHPKSSTEYLTPNGALCWAYLTSTAGSNPSSNQQQSHVDMLDNLATLSSVGRAIGDEVGNVRYAVPRTANANWDTTGGVLTSLSTWPTRFSNFQTSWRNKLDRERKESKKKSRKVKTTVTEGDYPDGVVAGFEAWALVQQLSGMTTKSFLQKTTKNLQAMGTALMWILESRASAEELYPTTTLVNTLYQGTPASGSSAGSLSIVDLLRPLSYAINSSFMAAFCDLDLQKKHGHVMQQYETRLFLGRYRSPRLAYMEDLLLTVVRDIAI
ncbi:hypothetical protein B0H14DRAFT_2580580, partial [Mycena olivaceomarginata]